jgi:soluble lytic murein transglycosylase
MKANAWVLLFLSLTVSTFFTPGFSPLGEAAISQTKTSRQERARASLRAAVAAGSETELRQLEQDFPETEEAALARLLRGYLRLQAKDYTAAAALLEAAMIARHSALGDYALYYRGQALLQIGRHEEAEAAFRRLAEAYPTSLLWRSAALQAAGIAFVRGAYQVAIERLGALVEANDPAALKLQADALEKLGRREQAIATLRKIYFNAPESPEASSVQTRLRALGSSLDPADAAELRQRADRLYLLGLYLVAAEAYVQLAVQLPSILSDEAWLQAGISYYEGGSYARALEALSRVRARRPKEMAEVLYYLGATNLQLRREGAMLQALAELRQAAPSSPRLASLLYLIGNYYEKNNQEAQAADYYQQLVREFPRDAQADEAHFWLAWRAHTAKNYPLASKLLIEHLAEYGKVTDSRGKAAFWGARSAERAGEKGQALALYRALLRRYGAGWYGYNAERRIAQLEQEGVKVPPYGADSPLGRAIANLYDNAPVVETIRPQDRERVKKAEQLLRIGLQQLALGELEEARTHAPNSPIVNLRIAQIYQARNENAAAINVLRRAFPDYAQALPEEMTREVWAIFYPLKWWETIQQESRRHNLDPYLIAGLIRQESIFNPQARSRANALGLMQLLPSTGRLVARRYGIGGWSVRASDLYDPILNIQLGTAYVAQLIEQFGRLEYSVAAYNGGPTRVARWLRELPGAEIEEWVESIPITETRLYVQGVYRNARQYQRLYDHQGRFRANVPE